MNIRLAKHFLLVLTPCALDRCIGDDEQQDWIHKVGVRLYDMEFDKSHWVLFIELTPDLLQLIFNEIFKVSFYFEKNWLQHFVICIFLCEAE